MGFKIPDTVVLTFEGAFEGLEIRCRLGLPIREQLEIRRLTKDIDTDDDGAFEAIFRTWFDRVSPAWNVEDDGGNPVPISADAVLARLPGEVLIQIMPKWREAMGVNAPLVATSPSGDPSPGSPTPTLASQSESLTN